MFNFQKYKTLIFGVVIFLVAVLPFLINFKDFFLSDDWDFLTISAHQTNSWFSYLSSNYLGTHDGGSYRPMVNFLWSFNYKLFQLNPLGYHSVSIFLNAINSLLVYGIILFLPWFKENRTRTIVAFLAALYFSIIPNHAEPVIWLAAVNDILMAFFYLASLWFLLLANRDYRRWSFLFYVVSLISFFCALLTKEMALTLPFVVALFTIGFHCRLKFSSWKKNALVVAPYFVLLIFYFWLRYKAIGLFFGYYGDEHLKFSFQKIYQAYTSITVSHLFSDNLRTSITSWLFIHPYLTLIPLAIIISLLAIYSIKKRRGLSLWLVGSTFLLSIVPVMKFGINVTPVYFSEEGERYAYLPSVFFAIFVALIVVYFYRYLIAKKKSLAIIFLSLIAVIFIGSASQLLIKNFRWHHASEVAQASLNGAVQIMSDQDFQAVLFFGLPDNEHGADIFRNSWKQAISFYLEEKPAILQPFNRSLVEKNQNFLVERIGDRQFVYSAENKNKIITAKPEFNSLDYKTTLEDFSFDENGLDLRYFGSGLKIEISENLAKSNVGYFFWGGSGWVVMD